MNDSTETNSVYASSVIIYFTAIRVNSKTGLNSVQCQLSLNRPNLDMVLLWLDNIGPYNITMIQRIQECASRIQMMAVKDHLVTKVRVSLCRRAVYFFDNNGLRHSQSHTRNKNM